MHETEVEIYKNVFPPIQTAIVVKGVKRSSINL